MTDIHFNHNLFNTVGCDELSLIEGGTKPSQVAGAIAGGLIGAGIGGLLGVAVGVAIPYIFDVD
jgi:hypothetical protein